MRIRAPQSSRKKEQALQRLQCLSFSGSAWVSAEAVLPGHPQVVLAAVKLHGYALEYASEELKNDREFLLEAVRETKASWLAHFASESLREDPSFRAECSQAAGTGLVFTYYESYDCLDYMRTCFPTAAASVPGGQAYAEVMEKMKVREGSGLACTGEVRIRSEITLNPKP